MQQEGDYIGDCRLSCLNLYQEIAYHLDDAPSSWPELISAAFENARKLNRDVRLWIEAYMLGNEDEATPLCVIQPDGEVRYELTEEDDNLDIGYGTILQELRELIEKEKSNGVGE